MKRWLVRSVVKESVMDERCRDGGCPLSGETGAVCAAQGAHPVSKR